jgi:hypothetical protein
MILAQFFPTWHEFWHPLEGVGYQWHSGVEGNFGELVLIGTLLVSLWRVRKHLECHVESPKNCHRIGRPVPGTGHRACRLHHPHASEKGTCVTAEDIARHHEDSRA